MRRTRCRRRGRAAAVGITLKPAQRSAGCGSHASRRSGRLPQAVKPWRSPRRARFVSGGVDTAFRAFGDGNPIFAAIRHADAGGRGRDAGWKTDRDSQQHRRHSNGSNHQRGYGTRPSPARRPHEDDLRSRDQPRRGTDCIRGVRSNRSSLGHRRPGTHRVARPRSSGHFHRFRTGSEDARLDGDGCNRACVANDGAHTRRGTDRPRCLAAQAHRSRPAGPGDGTTYTAPTSVAAFSCALGLPAGPERPSSSCVDPGELAASRSDSRRPFPGRKLGTASTTMHSSPGTSGGFPGHARTRRRARRPIPIACRDRSTR